jgi:hypothetical protein
LIDLKHDRLRDIVPNQIEVRPTKQVRNVRLLTRKEIIDANNVMSFVDESFAKVRPQKPGPAGD